MGKAIIRVPHIDTVIIKNVNSFHISEVGMIFYSGLEQNGDCVGIAPLNAIVEIK